MTKETYKKALAIPILILNKMGLWPERRICLTVVIKVLFNMFIAIITEANVLHNIANGIRTRDMNLLNWSICVLIPLVNLHTKAISLWTHRKIFYSIIEDLESDAFNLHSEKMNRHIQIIGTVANMIVRYFAMVMTIFLSISSLLPAFTNVPLMMPASFDTGSFDVPYRIGHLFITSYLATMSATLDTFYMTLIALSGAQLNILNERLINVLEEAKEAKANIYKEDFDVSVWNILKECVILHDTITKYVKKLGIVLSLPLLLQYASGCFIICNTILQITILGERDPRTIIGLCGYSGTVLAQMSFYHWLGNEVIFKSNQIIESCYLSKWYKLNLASQKCMLVLTERAKKPMVITLYSLVFVSLDSLGVIARWAYSLFALIKARYD